MIRVHPPSDTLSPSHVAELDSARSTPSPPGSPSFTVSPPPPLPQRHHRTPRPSFSLPAQRPKEGKESYMASASESQTDAGDGADEDSTASEREGSLRRGMLGEGLMDARDGRRRGLAGDSGRGEHVLIGRRLSPRSEALADRRLSWDGLRSGTWGSALFEALEAHAPKRRTSPAPRPLRPARGRPLRPPEPPIPRAPTPPLTIDDIAASSFNPFPLFHIRVHLIPEVVLLVTAFLFAVFRLYTISPTAAYQTISPLPLASLAFLALATPFLALFRRPDSYFKAPFTDERGYRDQAAADDGIATAILLPLLLAAACYWDTYSSSSGGGAAVGLGGIRPFMDIWEAAGIHAKSKLGAFDPAVLSTPFALARGLLQARHELVLLTSLNAVVLLVHLALSRTLLRIEKLPKNNTKRFFGFMAVSGGISLAVYVGLAVWDWTARGGLPISPVEAGVSTFIQQSSFYIVSRLARRGFTLGELNTMTVAGNALCLEFWRLSRSRWLYKRGYPSVPPTFRSPTPILAFQSVLIPGAFLSGFLLSPLLVISRHIASKPSHRLKWPGERERHRRVLAAGVFLGLFGIVFGMLGGWAGWMLGGGLRRPWTWAVTLVFYGGDGVPSLVPIHGWQRWKRLVLVAYWAGTIVVAVGGWQTRLVRARRIRMRNGASKGSGSEMSKGKESAKVGAEQAREDKRVHASLNMRRKFFHALAVMMFVPGIAVDPAFTSLAFSVAFALFTFSEYARYFALYPIGAPLHIFFSEFIDSKDSGPVILSHFYLLSGCAGGLWLEGRGVNRFTGVLVLGVGDALASIIGKLVGRVRWPGTSKTVEGTIAFVVSIVTCAWALRATGLTEPFSLTRYTIATTLAALLEAASKQNDNLIIPIYMWSMVTLLNV